MARGGPADRLGILKKPEAQPRGAATSRNPKHRTFVMCLPRGLPPGAADRAGFAIHVPAKSKHFVNHRIYQ
jgi:hypothetical protein